MEPGRMTHRQFFKQLKALDLQWSNRKSDGQIRDQYGRCPIQALAQDSKFIAIYSPEMLLITKPSLSFSLSAKVLDLRKYRLIITAADGEAGWTRWRLKRALGL